MNYAGIGRKLTPESVATLFEVEKSTVLKQYRRFGGVKIGRKVLFFENYITEKIRKAYAIQSENEEQDVLERPSKKEGEKRCCRAFSDQGGSTGLGKQSSRGGNQTLARNGTDEEDLFGIGD